MPSFLGRADGCRWDCRPESAIFSVVPRHFSYNRLPLSYSFPLWWFLIRLSVPTGVYLNQLEDTRVRISGIFGFVACDSASPGFYPTRNRLAPITPRTVLNKNVQEI